MTSANVQFLQKAGVLVLYISSRADSKEFAAIPDLLSERLGNPGTPPLRAIVVDLKDTPELDPGGWEQLQQRLHGIPGKHRFFVVNVSPGLDRVLGKANVKAQYELLGAVDDVFQKLGQKGSLKPEPPVRTAEDKALEKVLIQTFQRSAILTLEIQCSTRFKAGEAFVKSPKNKIVHDIAATMGLMGKSVNGSVALGFQENTFLRIMGRMLGEDYTSISSDVEDGCGELLNIIFGQAKKGLNENGHLFGKTLPTIFVGPALRVRQLTPNPAFILPFESDLGQMVLELGYRKA